MNTLKNLIQWILSKIGVTIYRSSSISGYSLYKETEIAELRSLARAGTLAQILSLSQKTADLPAGVVQKIITSSKSQLGQDILAISRKGVDKPGYFVEFGATNGIDLSNTYILEKNFGWTGILCEPATNWRRELMANRDSIIDTRCVYSTSGEILDFSESSEGELSTLNQYVKSDSHSRDVLKTYQVTSVSLFDLLVENGAPNFIDFISIDTEGSEYLILHEFNFDEYEFGLICVEHNFTENRSKINELLSSKGYLRVYEEFSKWDDWYVPKINQAP